MSQPILMKHANMQYQLSPFRLPITNTLQIPSNGNEMEPIESLKLNDDYSLMKHQVDAIKAMHENQKQDRGMILNAEKGLGKTLTGLAYGWLNRHCGKTLVVTELAILHEWHGALNEFFGQHSQLRVLILHEAFPPVGYKKSQWKDTLERVNYTDIENYDVIVTTYDVIKASRRNLLRYGIDTDKRICIYGARGKKAGFTNPCSYDLTMTVIGKGILHSYPWHAVIADESHGFRDHKSIGFLAMSALPISRNGAKFGLTGSMIVNYDKDAWSQLFYCGYNKIQKPRYWRREMRFEEPAKSMIMHIDMKKAGIVLPEKKVLYYHYTPDKYTKDVYRHFLGDLMDQLESFEHSDTQYAHILVLFARLRQIAIAPYLITEESKSYKEKVPKNVIVAPGQASYTPTAMANSHSEEVLALEEKVHDINQAGFSAEKLRLVMCLLCNKLTENVELTASGQKPNQILLFSSFTAALHLIAEALNLMFPGRPGLFEIIHGAVKPEARGEIFKKFQAGKITILLINYKIGSCGLNLTAANHVIPLEPWWNPATPDQAVARAWRLRQTREVTVHN